MRLYAAEQDLKSNDLSLNEATDVAQNRPLWRLMSTFGIPSDAYGPILLFSETEVYDRCEVG